MVCFLGGEGEAAQDLSSSVRDLNTGQWGAGSSSPGLDTKLNTDVSVTCPIGLRPELENSPGVRTSLLVELSAGNSLVVQWLGFCAFIAEGSGSLPGRGTKIPQGVQCGQKKKKKKKEENLVLLFNFGLPWWLRWSRICLECQRPRFDPWIRKIPWRTE